MNPAPSPPPVSRRRALSALALGAVAPATLAGCIGGSTTRPRPSTASPPTPSITYQPTNAAVDVAPTGPVGVQVRDGYLQRVTLTNRDGTLIAGTVTQDRTGFAVTEPLGYDMAYTWGGSVVGDDGKAVPVTGTFTTVAPTATVNGQFQLADGQVVGVAAPIILQFDASISDKAAVEKALTVTTDPPVEGSWAWLPDEVGGSRVHWRTRDYYPAGTKVAVDAPLYGVPMGAGAFGGQSLTLTFETGRRQVVQAVASSYRILVVTDDGVIMDLPCSYGQADLPRNVTRSGTHVVSEKNADFYMSNPAAGYFNVHERFAVRISNNGEFIHANPNTIGVQGSTNVTNGCINLSLDNARQYFESAIYGDPVEVSGTSIELSAADGDLWDWAVDWDTWVSMSAVASPSAPPASVSIPATAPAIPPEAPVLSDVGPASGRPGG